jgi:hypothetical protein
MTDDYVARALAKGFIDDPGVRSLMDTARESNVRSRIVGRRTMVDCGTTAAS